MVLTSRAVRCSGLAIVLCLFGYVTHDWHHHHVRHTKEIISWRFVHERFSNIEYVKDTNGLVPAPLAPHYNGMTLPGQRRPWLFSAPDVCDATLSLFMFREISSVAHSAYAHLE